MEAARSIGALRMAPSLNPEARVRVSSFLLLPLLTVMLSATGSLNPSLRPDATDLAWVPKSAFDVERIAILGHVCIRDYKRLKADKHEGFMTRL